MNITGYLELNARNAPDEPAAFFEGATYDRDAFTWGELDAEASRFAGALTDHGLTPGDNLVMYASKTPEFLPAFFGALKAGVRLLPINTMFGADDVDYMITHLDASAVFTTADLVDRLADVDLSSVDRVYVTGEGGDAVDTETRRYDEAIGEGDEAFETVPRGMDDTAYFVHTAGTTGRPKPAVFTHGNLHAWVLSYVDWLELSADDVALNVIPLYHTGGLHPHLLTFTMLGAPQVVMDPWDPERALEAIETHGVSYTLVVPTMIYDWINLDPSTAEEAYDTGSLEIVAAGGQSVPRPTVETFEDRFHGEVYEVWGMTETVNLITMDRPGDRKLGTAGRVIESMVDLRVVDPEDWRTEMPVGERGEALVSGDVVTPGYYERPDLDEEDFETDEDGRRWFHTGDIVRLDGDGRVTVEDRVDNMIISGGENVYPSEIEEVLYEIDGVEEAVVVGEPHDRWGERVAAAIVTTDPGLEPDDIYDYCEDHDGLADHQRPRNVVLVDELPRHGPEKIDRKRIEEEYFDNP